MSSHIAAGGGIRQQDGRPVEIEAEERKGILRTDPSNQSSHHEQNQRSRQADRKHCQQSTASGVVAMGLGGCHRGEASAPTLYVARFTVLLTGRHRQLYCRPSQTSTQRSPAKESELSFGSGAAVARHVEHDVEFQRLPVPIPPASFAMMTRAEIDFGAVGQSEFYLYHVVGTAGTTLQRFNRYASSPVHVAQSSHLWSVSWRICVHKLRLRPFPATRRASQRSETVVCLPPTSRRTSRGHGGTWCMPPCRT